MIAEDEMSQEIKKLYDSPNSLSDFIHKSSFNEAITSRSNVTLGKIFPMVLKFSHLNDLSVTGMVNLLKMLNTTFTSRILPETRYVLDKILNPSDGIQFHAVCPHCTEYLGMFGHTESQSNCSNCKQTLKLNEPCNTSFFVLIDPSKQISALINKYKNYYTHLVKEREHQKGFLRDVYDGKEQRSQNTGQK